MKKVLIISQNSLSRHANNGKTLTNIFQAWDKENLAQLYFQDEIPESSDFDKFYRLRDIDVLKKIINSSTCAVWEVKPLSFVEDHYVNRSNIFLKFINIVKKFTFIKDLLREIIYGFYGLYLKELENKISKFKPEIFFIVASDYTFTISISLKLAKKFNIPVYFYILDDRFFMRKKNLFGYILNFNYVRKFRQVVEESQGCFCIGHLMADKYSKYFKKDFHVLVNPIDVKKLTPVDKFYKENIRNYKILYAGGVTLGRFDAILDFAKILKNIENNNLSIEFMVCSGDFLSETQLKKMKDLSINFRGKLNYQALDKLYNSVDFVTHIESNKSKNMKFTYLSVSTKIPECLAKGICLICFGPPEIASMKLIYENNLGFYLNSNNDFELNCDVMSEFLKSSELCNNLVLNGKLFSEKNFTHEVISQQLVYLIES